jgi:hypothetical protein
VPLPVMPSYFPVPPVISRVPWCSGGFDSVTLYLAKTFAPSPSVKVL